VLVAALGIDSQGFRHPLGLMEGATEHSAVVQALMDDRIERGLDPAVPRFMIDGSKALAKAIRRSFGRHTPIQRCQIRLLLSAMRLWGTTVTNISSNLVTLNGGSGAYMKDIARRIAQTWISPLGAWPPPPHALRAGGALGPNRASTGQFRVRIDWCSSMLAARGVAWPRGFQGVICRRR